MVVINKDEFAESKRRYMKLLKKTVFIYPTDSIYGLGCDATNRELVDKVRRLKKSNIQPFIVIAPSKKWIYDNCIVGPKQAKYVEKLGGKLNMDGEDYAFTVILRLKNKSAVAKNVTCGLDTIGVRIPAHWFSKVISELGFPVVTTSANAIGEDFMTNLDNLNDRLKRNVDLIIYEGELESTPSTLIHAEDLKENIKIRPRTK